MHAPALHPDPSHSDNPSPSPTIHDPISPTQHAASKGKDGRAVIGSSASTAAPSHHPSNRHHDATPRLSKARQYGIIITCSIVMMNNVGSGPAITVAMPDIGRELNIAAANLQWIVSAYALTSGCFLLLFGKLADIYGRRLVFLFGTAWMGVWSLACGFAPTEIGIDVMRGLQGLGPAAAVPASIGILAQSFEEGSHMRTIAFAAFGSGGPIGAALGNVLSGFLTQWTSPGWKSAFYSQAGIAFFSCALGLIFVLPDSQTHLASQLSVESTSSSATPTSSDTKPQIKRPKIIKRRGANQVDWLGAVLITVGLVLLTFSLGDGETAKPNQWKSPYIIVLLILSVLIIGVFVWWEARLGGWKDVEDEDEVRKREEQNENRRGEETDGDQMGSPDELEKLEPLLKLSIFGRANGKLIAMAIVAFFVWAAFGGWSLYAVLYYQTYLGLGPVLQMVRMLPLSVVGVLCTVIVALAAARIPGIILVVFGCALMSTAPLLFAIIDTSKSYWAYGFPAAITCVFGADIIFAGGSLFVAKVALPHEQSLAGGLFQTLTQLGTSIGLSLISIVLDRTITKKARELGVSVPSGGAALNNAPKEALLAGYRAAQWMSFAYAMAGMLIALVWLRDMGIIAPRRRKDEFGVRRSAKMDIEKTREEPKEREDRASEEV